MLFNIMVNLTVWIRDMDSNKQMWTYRRMLRILWAEKMSNATELNRLNVKDRLFKIIQGKKLKYFGHIIRHDDTLQRTVLDWKVKGKMGRGRPRTKWTKKKP